jgi:hypothetical protein
VGKAAAAVTFEFIARPHRHYQQFQRITRGQAPGFWAGSTKASRCGQRRASLFQHQAIPGGVKNSWLARSVASARPAKPAGAAAAPHRDRKASEIDDVGDYSAGDGRTRSQVRGFVIAVVGKPNRGRDSPPRFADQTGNLGSARTWVHCQITNHLEASNLRDAVASKPAWASACRVSRAMWRSPDLG